MGRPRKGVVQRPDGQWTVSLPIAVGSKQTRQFTDPDETAVRRWYADGERALAAGQPLPDPDSYRTNRPAPALPALALGDRTPAHWWAGPTAAFGHRAPRGRRLRPVGGAVLVSDPGTPSRLMGAVDRGRGMGTWSARRPGALRAVTVG